MGIQILASVKWSGCLKWTWSALANIHDFVKLHAQYACSVCWVHVSVSVHSHACMNAFSPILDMFSWSLSPQCTNVASCTIYW